MNRLFNEILFLLDYLCRKTELQALLSTNKAWAVATVAQYICHIQGHIRKLSFTSKEMFTNFLALPMKTDDNTTIVNITLVNSLLPFHDSHYTCYIKLLLFKTRPLPCIVLYCIDSCVQ